MDNEFCGKCQFLVRGEMPGEGERKKSRILEIELVERRKFYDSVWRVVFSNEDGTDTITIVRYDDESLHGVCHALDSLEEFTKKSIMNLDMKNRIYYD